MKFRDGVRDDRIPFLKLSKRASYVSIAIVAALSCICSLDGDFVFDDSEALINNNDIRLSTPVTQLFYNDFWGTKMNHNQSHKSYRPITVLSFRLNLLLSDGILTPFKFKFTNLLLHSTASILCFEVYEMLLDGYSPTIVTLSSLLFAVHPIHTEAVAGIVGRAELLCAIFSFSGFLVYCKAIRAAKVMLNIVWSFISCLLIGLAMFSKEQGITMIGICILYDIIIANKLHPKHVIQIIYVWYRELRREPLGLISCKVNGKLNNKNKSNSVDIKNNVERGFNINKLCLLILRASIIYSLGIILIYIRLRIMGSPPKFQKTDNLAAFSESWLVRIINYYYIYALHGWLLIYPKWLCFDWSMGCIPLITSIMDTRILAVVAFWIIFAGLWYSVLNGENNKFNRGITMALSIITLSFLPASNLFFKVGFVVAERVLYLPSVGYCLLIGLGIQRLASRSSNTFCYMILRLSLWFLILTFCARSIGRSFEWRSEKVLFESALNVCPLNAKVHYNLGKVANNKKMAIDHYREAIRLNPEYDQAMNNLANILKDDGFLDEAENLLWKAVELRPDFAAAWMNLGIVLSNKKHHKKAEECLFKALKYRSQYPDCYYNLGNLFLDQKRYNEAYIAWNKAILQNPKHSIAWNNLIIMLDSIGEQGKAETAAMEALKVLPADAALHFNLANSLGKLSRFDEAEEHFHTAIRLKPDQALYYVNLGVLYHRWKKYEKAKEMYYEALAMDPSLESAQRNLKMLS